MSGSSHKHAVWLFSLLVFGANHASPQEWARLPLSKSLDQVEQLASDVLSQHPLLLPGERPTHPVKAREERIGSESTLTAYRALFAAICDIQWRANQETASARSRRRALKLAERLTPTADRLTTIIYAGIPAARYDPLFRARAPAGASRLQRHRHHATRVLMLISLVDGGSTLTAHSGLAAAAVVHHR